jgi:hypothetical protein
MRVDVGGIPALHLRVRLAQRGTDDHVRVGIAMRLEMLIADLEEISGSWTHVDGVSNQSTNLMIPGWFTSPSVLICDLSSRVFSSKITLTA